MAEAVLEVLILLFLQMTLKLSLWNIFEKFKPGVQGEIIYNTNIP